MTKSDVIASVKARLRIEDSSLDSLIELYADEVFSRILHYTNLDAIPEDLEPVWAAMVAEIIKQDQAASPIIAAALGGVDVVSVGDTSVRVSALRSTIDNTVKDYKKDLYRYRKIRW